MKILFVIDNLGSGGAQRQMIGLAICFKQRGHDVSFLIYHKINFYKELISLHNIPIKTIIEANYLKRLLKFRKFIRNGNYYAVLSFLESPNLICELSGLPFRRWKLIVGERSANPLIKKSLKLTTFRWFHIFADYIVSNSSLNMKMVKEVNPLLSKSKCKVIFNFIDFEIWKPSENYHLKIVGKLKLIVVANHRPVKNLNGLIDALSLLSISERNKLKIDWYGDWEVSSSLDNSFDDTKRKITNLKLNNVITFYPETKEIVNKVQEADAIGLFSFYEGLPNSICEGMACGKPVICAAVSDLPSLLSFDKNLLFNPYEPQSIKKALEYLISLKSDYLRLIGSRNLSIAKENFEKEVIISDYLCLLNL